MKIHALGTITDAEKTLIAAAVPELSTSIEKVSSFFLSTSMLCSRAFPSSFRACRSSRLPSSEL